jgi:hypothetical protein
MLITKENHIYITFDNEAIVSLEDIIKSKSLICLDFNTKSDTATESMLLITNPGEYEFAGILLKVISGNNTFISADMTKIFYINSIKSIKEHQDIENADIVIIDNIDNEKIQADAVLEIQKRYEPKNLFVNGNLLEGEITSSETNNKFKVKSSELSLTPDSKIFIVK